MKSPIISLCHESASRLQRDSAWWKIYNTNFPDNERESSEVILRMLKRKRGVVIRAQVKNRTVGLATIHLLKNTPAVFLGYLAVEDNMRKHHVGTMLFEYAWEIGASLLYELGLAPLGYIWEVEIPSMTKGSKKLICNERIRFYRHRGAIILKQKYILPPLKNHGKSMPMFLMFRGIAGNNFLGSKDVKKLIRSIYIEKYHAMNLVSRETLRPLMVKLKINPKF